MTETHAEDERRTYRIAVRGRLDGRWSDWFSGLTVSQADGAAGAPISILSGVFDQATLRGIANRAWDLNLTLISITIAETDV